MMRFTKKIRDLLPGETMIDVFPEVQRSDDWQRRFAALMNEIPFPDGTIMGHVDIQISASVLVQPRIQISTYPIPVQVTKKKTAKRSSSRKK